MSPKSREVSILGGTPASQPTADPTTHAERPDHAAAPTLTHASTHKFRVHASTNIMARALDFTPGRRTVLSFYEPNFVYETRFILSDPGESLKRRICDVR
jgi:hypothetical protein